ncbi:hypothetical protein BC939DRAFT_312008 [Gamsiella multidivaricata]|uniref:uncharacterized protein n=1 Tax=Gamsiella multidivaricata TaxID=101098 RepID=UPI0022207416|nr:uncharacterized protein BC939DRAFT_312008 [Gamsiella multidivaricata]KAI7817935.1 hypothetical protein BC939DRAFT_312008 [Gamsiella multidivaricata]
MEEEFAKRQAKRKEKERKRIQLPSGEMSDTAANTSVSLSEHLAIHGVNGVTSTHQEVQHQQLQATAAALNPAASQFDPNTVKTALALNDLVKKNGGAHLDLASLLSDPNLARQLLELEASSAAAAAAATQPPAAMVIMNTTPKSDPEAVKTSHMLDTDYPMDAVLTLMQLNGSWKA